MGFKAHDLWRPPVLNPVNKKARSVPVFNPLDRHGRVFFFSWLGFMLAFWAWYTFPPLLTVTIKKDLGLTPAEVANSNIVSLVATLFVRFVAGPLCDQIGARRVFSLILLLGSIPIGLAPLIKNATGLYVIRFFIGILGGSFVPCQVWCTGWFDKNVVGTANGLAGGWGNAGGGITYFIMPAVYDSLVHHFGHAPSAAWRITFVVPLVCLIVCGLGLLFLCDDTPMGKWDERHQHVQENLVSHGLSGEIVAVPGTVADPLTSRKVSSDEEKTISVSEEKEKKLVLDGQIHGFDHEVDISRTEAIETAQGEIVIKPSFKEALSITFSLHGLFFVATYACSFGGELAVNSILGAYYFKNFPALGQTQASNFAAIFGFLNFVTRPLGGVVSDLLYNGFGRNLWLKKAWIHVCGILTGIFLIVIGVLDPHNLSTMVGLISLMAVFHEAGNGANFALVPHVYPYANGILSGLTGAGGNLGGVFFAIVFRFMDGGTNYAKAFWVIGIMHIGLNLLVCWIPPLPKGQIGGR
ncbi:major facilitator superfamily domain-containing protein [Lasiosphaeria hispida]|uniref:Nitrate/nitrite transporter n=1 Tax=Lasiosphaeria hispida TaxID=260671 RepID=A0AAJ0HP98_9PEZI|nr:major facilitator superfamily domain-containing protein [Lasiosphaeria hispida]